MPVAFFLSQSEKAGAMHLEFEEELNSERSPKENKSNCEAPEAVIFPSGDILLSPTQSEEAASTLGTAHRLFRQP